MRNLPLANNLETITAGQTAGNLSKNRRQGHALIQAADGVGQLSTEISPPALAAMGIASGPTSYGCLRVLAHPSAGEDARAQHAGS